MRMINLLFRGFLVSAIIVIFFNLEPLSIAAGPLTVTVMTLNLHNGQDSAGQPNLDRFLELIATEQPDLIALQEVERRHFPAFRAAGYQVIPGMNANLPFFRFGNVILTKHKIVYHRHHYLPSNREQRGLNETAIEISGQHFRVLNIHLGLGWTEQKQQLDEINRIASFLNEPLLILGDFNLEPSHSLLKDFQFRQVGSVFPLPKTFPASNPQYQLDLIWYSPHWEPLEAKVLSWDGSDHLPVTARLKLKEPSLNPLTAVEMPDLTKENNPLLPDPGDPIAAINIGAIRSETGDNLRGKAVFTWRRRLSAAVAYDGEDPIYTIGVNKILDLRDYASLMGIRGKGQWSFSISQSSGLRPWFTWEQYYRWSSRWGTKLIANIGHEPDWSLEQLYLPAKYIRYSFRIDTESNLKAGMAVSLARRQFLEVKWIKGGQAGKFGASWTWALSDSSSIK